MWMMRWRLRLPTIPLLQAGQRAEVLEQTMTTALRAALAMTDAELVKRTPVGVSGRASSAWTQRVEIVSSRPLNLLGQNVNITPYALPLDAGQTPHWPPWGPGSDLALWAKRKLGDEKAAFLVARSIARGTTRGTAITGVQMVQQTLAATRQPILAVFHAARRHLARRWMGGGA